jgi:membrane protease YdiL (CAAX protease family)
VGDDADVGFTLTAVVTIVRDIALVALIAFFLWRNHEPPPAIGWVWRDAGREMALGALLYLPLVFAMGILDAVLRAFGLSSPADLPGMQPAATFKQITLALVLVAVVAVAEEIIFRGYLLHRLTVILGRPWLAVVLGALIFSTGHGYQGSLGVAMVGFLGLVFGVVALWRRSLVAPITMHFLQNFLAMVVVPFADSSG